MNASRVQAMIVAASRLAAVSAALVALLAGPSLSQDDMGAKDKAAGEAAAPAGGTMDRLQGAAGVGAAAGAGEAMKGAGVGGAAKKGGAAAVQDYMKVPGAGGGTTGEAAPAKDSDAEPEEAQ